MCGIKNVTKKILCIALMIMHAGNNHAMEDKRVKAFSEFIQKNNITFLRRNSPYKNNIENLENSGIITDETKYLNDTKFFTRDSDDLDDKKILIEDEIIFHKEDIPEPDIDNLQKSLQKMYAVSYDEKGNTKISLITKNDNGTFHEQNLKYIPKKEVEKEVEK